MERSERLDALSWIVAAEGPLTGDVLAEIEEHLAQLEDAPGKGRGPRSIAERAEALVQSVRADPAWGDELRGVLRELVAHLQSPSGAPEPAVPPGGPDPDILELFLASCSDGLDGLEASLLALESDLAGRVDLDDVRRTIHTLKGEYGVLSLDVAQTLYHQAEDAIDAAMSGGAELPTDALLQLVDWSRRYLAVLTRAPAASPPPHEALLARFLLAPGRSAADSAPAEESEGRVSFDPEALTDETLPEFLTESGHHLEDAEAALLELEEDPSEEECINRVFRAFHTIKGVAGFLNLGPICELAHSTETLLGKFRQSELVFSSAHGDLLLSAKDMMGRLLEALAGGPSPRRAELDGLVHHIDEAALTGLVPAPTAATAVREALEVIGIVDDEQVGEAARAPNETVLRLGELLVQRGALGQAQLQLALDRQGALAALGAPPKIGEILVEFGFVTPGQVQEALALQGARSPIVQLLETRTEPRAERDRPLRADNTIKVSMQRLDSLVDMVGELVIAQQMVAHDEALVGRMNERLERNLSQLGKITRDLQEASMSLRMVTFRSTFQKMNRLVRDVSAKARKHTHLLIEGADTEVDRNVVEKISDPLVHLIRNAVDHGLETPEERLARGKPAEGQIVLAARHQGGAIVVSVSDDGRGLARPKILAKAVERGLVSPAEAAELSDAAVAKLIFQPGFSTAAVVTDISGRGVGMDVVRRNIESMRGKIDIQSVAGRGTTFVIQLPLTLAIIDAMVVRAGPDRFVLPTLSIVQSFQPSPEQIHSLCSGTSLVTVRDQLVPVYSLRGLLAAERGESATEDSVLILIEALDRQVCLVVDEILGQQQIVIKSLGEGLLGIPVVSGGAILGDGKVALIVDIEGILSEVESTVQC